MSDKKVYAVDNSQNDKTAKFIDADLLVGQTLVDDQEVDSAYTVQDKEEVRRANLYLLNDSSITVDYGGAIYVTDGICTHSQGQAVGSEGQLQVSNGLGEIDSASWSVNSSNSLIPNQNNAYDIGSTTMVVRDLYLGPSSLNIASTGSSYDFLTISAKGYGDSAGDFIFTGISNSNSLNSITNYSFENSGDTDNLETQISLRGGPSSNYHYLRFKTDEGMTDGITLKFPDSPSSTTGQYLSVGAGSSGEQVNLVWTTPSSSGLNNVVEDTTPELGGNLDAQDNNISNINVLSFNSGPEIRSINNDWSIYLNPSYGTANAANAVRIGPIGLAAAARDNNYANGTNRNICQIEADSGKSLVLGANAFSNTSRVQINSGTDAEFSGTEREGIELRMRETVGESGKIASVSIKSTSLNADDSITSERSPKLKFYNPDDYYVSFEAPGNGVLSADVKFILPVSDGSVNQVLKTNGSGQLGWVDQPSGGLNNVVEDTTPQLGGSLDLNLSDITGTGNIDITGNVTATLVKSNLEGAIHFNAQAAENILEGEVVYVSGLSGNTPIVSKARANSSSTMPAFGIASENINLNNTGNIVTLGTKTGLNISNFGEVGVSFALGDTLYVSSSQAGKITNISPSGESNLIQNIGKIERATPTDNISIKVGGAGRSNATPALNNGNIFIGDSSNRSVTSNLQTLVESYSINNVSEDTTPQLGGNLDLNSNDITGTGNVDITGNVSISGDFKGSTYFVENGMYEEYGSLSSGYTDKVTFNCNNKHVFVLSNLDRNIVANFENLQFSSGTVGVTSVTLIIKQGATAYIANSIRIDDVVKTIEWQGNLVPSGTSNGVDVISFSIIYDGSTGYTILGQLVDFG